MHACASNHIFNKVFCHLSCAEKHAKCPLIETAPILTLNTNKPIRYSVKNSNQLRDKVCNIQCMCVELEPCLEVPVIATDKKQL